MHGLLKTKFLKPRAQDGNCLHKQIDGLVWIVREPILTLAPTGTIATRLLNPARMNLELFRNRPHVPPGTVVAWAGFAYKKRVTGVKTQIQPFFRGVRISFVDLSLVFS